ncbi:MULTISPECIES: metalloregulator ArsR/SmtB family transcription factor [unclassified Nocardioides]|uniref:metalloregulator ArsR/SmtB family transcription factor n=1 Tax=unclassified Nocardioides TaxID=2615069 RepID=UPI00361BC492
MSSTTAPPQFLRLAGHPVRWQLLAELALGDLRVRELVARLDLSQNLVSYHLRLLRDGGLVTTRRSTYDGRDSYYRLDLDVSRRLWLAAGDALHPSLRPGPIEPGALPRRPRRLRVLCACTGNTARSPIAAALLRHRSGGALDVVSAGSQPGTRFHPGAARVLRDEYGVGLGARGPRHLDSVVDRRFDYAITLCDRVREVVPPLPGSPVLVHWSTDDPSADHVPDDDTVIRRITHDIDGRVSHLLHVLADHHHPEGAAP